MLRRLRLWRESVRDSVRYAIQGMQDKVIRELAHAAIKRHPAVYADLRSTVMDLPLCSKCQTSWPCVRLMSDLEEIHNVDSSRKWGS